MTNAGKTSVIDAVVRNSIRRNASRVPNIGMIKHIVRVAEDLDGYAVRLSCNHKDVGRVYCYIDLPVCSIGENPAAWAYRLESVIFNAMEGMNKMKGPPMADYHYAGTWDFSRKEYWYPKEKAPSPEGEDANLLGKIGM